jgi:hypothetical protein
MATKQLELLLLRSNNFNNSDFKLVNTIIGASQNPYLYSKSLDVVIGENEYQNEGKWIISKDGDVLGVFQNDREVINFIINLNK